jgi:hypothetical protein
MFVSPWMVYASGQPSKPQETAIGNGPKMIRLIQNKKPLFQKRLKPYTCHQIMTEESLIQCTQDLLTNKARNKGFLNSLPIIQFPLGSGVEIKGDVFNYRLYQFSMRTPDLSAISDEDQMEECDKLASAIIFELIMKIKEQNESGEKEWQVPDISTPYGRARIVDGCVHVTLQCAFRPLSQPNPRPDNQGNICDNNGNGQWNPGSDQGGDSEPKGQDRENGESVHGD